MNGQTKDEDTGGVSVVQHGSTVPGDLTAGGKLTLRMWLNHERPTAIEVASAARWGNGTSTLTWWIPRSLMGDVRRTQATAASERDVIEFTLPVWKVRQANLYSFTTS